MFRKLTLAASLMVAGGTSMAHGQDVVLEELYGRGVHRFFAHDYVNAYEHLSLAIDNGSRDPRAFYFRGLTLLATGREDEAMSDWRMGAGLEASGLYADSVGRALSRVQGPARLHLEHIRQMARLEARSQATARDEAIYGSGASSPPVRIPLDGAAVEPAVPTPPSANNPFSEDGAVAGAPTVETSDALSGAIENATPAPVTPSADAGTTPAPVPAGNDPFGGGNTPAADDPFGGGSTPAADDPFGN